MPTLTSLASVLMLTLAALPAMAANHQAQEKIARKACLSGNYEKGVSILSDLFVETRDPNHIYNQARCFEQNRRYEDAIARFQEYLRSTPDLSVADKESAEKHIADCQALVAKESPRPQPISPEVETPSPPAPPVSRGGNIETASQTPSAGITSPQPEHAPPAASEGSGLRVAGIVTASVGAAALIGGVALNLKVNSMASDLESLGHYSDGKESSRKTYETLGWISYGVGGACIATAAVLYYFGIRSNDQSAVAITPIFASDRAGAAVGGRF